MIEAPKIINVPWLVQTKSLTQERLILRPHGRSEGRVSRFRRPGGWDIRSATGYPSVAHDTRAQAAQAVWDSMGGARCHHPR